MNTLNKLSELFSQFPGIGERQAKRFVYFLLSKNPTYAAELARLISGVKESISICETCFRFFPKEVRSALKCNICSDKNRDRGTLAIVSYDNDLESIEKTGSFLGNYFVLGGIVPILEKNPERRVRAGELLKEIERRANEGGLIEIVLAMSFNSDGENTVIYLREILAPLEKKHQFKITNLGRGLSLGTELEYSDSETLKSALKNRT